MKGFRPLVPTVCLALVAVAPLGAQRSPIAGQSEVQPSDSALEAQEGTEIRTSYDRRTDSTRVAVVTHSGWLGFGGTSPEVVWSVAYVGHEPVPEGVATVVLEMRTQDPQVATSSLLLMEYGAGRRFESRSVGIRSEPAMVTTGTWMRFILSASALSEVLEAPPVKLTIGGIPLLLTDNRLQALREMLARAGGPLLPAESARN
ncbi:MAG: hypothetical protein ACHQ2E_06195 [Gemmatimonadales bacterium]